MQLRELRPETQTLLAETRSLRAGIRRRLWVVAAVVVRDAPRRMYAGSVIDELKAARAFREVGFTDAPADAASLSKRPEAVLGCTKAM